MMHADVVGGTATQFADAIFDPGAQIVRVIVFHIWRQKIRVKSANICLTLKAVMVEFAVFQTSLRVIGNAENSVPSLLALYLIDALAVFQTKRFIHAVF